MQTFMGRADAAGQLGHAVAWLSEGKIFDVDPGNFYAIVGGRIREARRRKGCTQEDLAGTSQLTRSSIANIERGRQRLLLHTFFEIASAIGVAPATLLPDTPLSTDREQIVQTMLRGLTPSEQDFILSAVVEPEGGHSRAGQTKKNS